MHDPKTTVVTALAIVALFMAAFYLSWLDKNGRPRRFAVGVFWLIAVAFTILQAFAQTVGNDEVHYLISAWTAIHSAQHPLLQSWINYCALGAGESLPMRGWMAYPIVSISSRPSVILMTARLSMSLAAIVCAYLITLIGRKLERNAVVSPVIGAMALLSFTNLPFAGFRPEYVAFLFFMIGFWLVFATPKRISGEMGVFIGFIFLAFTACISIRQMPLIVSVLLALMIEPGKLKRSTALGLAVLGGIIGVLPTFYHVLRYSSIPEVYRSAVVWTNAQGWVMLVPRHPLPVIPLAASGIGCLYLLLNHRREASPIWLILLWVLATINANYMPMNQGYPYGPWYSLCFIIGVVAVSRMMMRFSDKEHLQWGKILLGLYLLFALLVPVLTISAKSNLIKSCRISRSQIALMDWLKDASGDGPIICMDPSHPITAVNATGMWNVWLYSYVWDRDTYRILLPGYTELLSGSKLRVIQWNAWPRDTGEANILQHAVDRGIIGNQDMPGIARSIANNYRLVRWKGPLPEHKGDSFLVRRDIRIDGRVEELNIQAVRDWRNEKE